MKQIIFKSIDISNFKGIEKQTIVFDDRTSLRGANGTGKTTIADAIWWVLFNKDSNGSTDFPVKRKDSQGNDIHNIIVDVNLTLTLNNVTHILRRTQEENWVTKRGSNDPVMEGNVQTLYYNESKMKSKEYQDAVNAILEEPTFKLLTNPIYFMSLDYKKRREELMKLVGNEKDIETAIRSQSSMFMLDQEWSQDINLNKSFAQLFDFVKQKAKQNADEIDRLPYQIDELQRTIKDFAEESTIKSLIAAYSRELAQLNEAKPETKPQSVIDAEETLRHAQKEHSTIVDSAHAQCASKRSETARMRQDHDFKIQSYQAKITLHENDRTWALRKLDEFAKRKAALLEDYNAIKNEVYIPKEVTTTCPVCHQTLPDVNPEKILADGLTHFYDGKTQRMNEVVEKGKAIATSINEYKEAIAKNDQTISNLSTDIDTEIMALSALPKVEDINIIDFYDEIKMGFLNDQIEELQKTISAYYQESAQPVNSDQPRKSELQALINDNNQRLGALNAQKETLKRIDELKGRESILQAEKNRFKTLVWLCETFEMKKNETIEQILSSHFGRIKWRLFKQQVNGGYQAVCDALLDGKPYEAQSTGERIYTGCDIIKTFQGIYETECAVLIDNRESLTLEVPLTSQVISMYADERYMSLKQA